MFHFPPLVDAYTAIFPLCRLPFAVALRCRYSMFCCQLAQPEKNRNAASNSKKLEKLSCQYCRLTLKRTTNKQKMCSQQAMVTFYRPLSTESNSIMPQLWIKMEWERNGWINRHSLNIFQHSLSVFDSSRRPTRVFLVIF